MLQSRSFARRVSLTGPLSTSSRIASYAARPDRISLSDTGAQLKFAGPTPLPPAFMLRVVSSGIEMHGELAWQRGLSAGVRFETPAVQKPKRFARRSALQKMNSIKAAISTRAIIAAPIDIALRPSLREADTRPRKLSNGEDTGD
jgi:hypothetical protein